MFQFQRNMLAHNPPGDYGGISIADVDGDGRFEVLVACSNGPNRILKWVGNQLRDVATPMLVDAGRSTLGFAAADIDGDGREELYLLNQSADRILQRGADGQWLDLLEHSRPPDAPASCGIAAIDRRGVGRYGFFSTHRDRPPRLLELGADGLLSDLAQSVGLHANLAGGVLATPLHGGHTDLICANERGANAAYSNLGSGTFEDCAGLWNLTDANECGQGIVALDADGDGRLDLFWGNADGPHRLMIRDSGTAWRDRATPSLAFPSALGSVVVADFDNDGHEELFLNNRGEQNRLYRVHDSITLLEVGDAAEPEALGSGAAVLDGDGVLELIVAHGEPSSEPIAVYKARGTAGNSWLRIRPLTRHGAPARGAAVRASVGGRVLVRVIDGGSGTRCQMEPVAHFGLGRSPQVEWVSVTWPDGASLTMPHPDVNCSYTVPYPRG